MTLLLMILTFALGVALAKPAVKIGRKVASFLGTLASYAFIAFAAFVVVMCVVPLFAMLA